jgi:hypothetical protein
MTGGWAGRDAERAGRLTMARGDVFGVDKGVARGLLA